MKVKIPGKLEFLFKPKRFKIAFGGRGGAKTVTFSKVLPLMGLTEKKRVLCLREYMNSIDDSVHASLKEEIGNLEMDHHYNITNNKIDGVNGSAFRFASFSRNISSIKSKHDFDIAWIEEAETVTQKSLDVLIPTMRKDGSEIWFSFNPEDEFSAIWKLVKPHLKEIQSKGFYEDDIKYICKINLEDNPFAPKELLAASELLRNTNLKKWLHIYGGEVFSDYKDSIIQPEWVDASIDAHIKLGFKAMGIKSLAFDPADTGADAKAAIMRHGSVITEGLRWSEGDITDAIDKAFQCANDWNADVMVYDDDGLGKSMKVYISKTNEADNIQVIPYNGNGSVDNPGEAYTDDGKVKTNKDHYRNKRAQYYGSLADRFHATYNAINKGIYTDPDKLISLSSELEDLDVLKSELVKIERKKGQNTYYQIKSKEDMRKDGVKSPNMADALKMCFANPAPDIEQEPLTFISEW